MGFVTGRGEGGFAEVIKGFQGMGQVRQVQKLQLAQKEKSADFKSPDLDKSAYTLIINYNHRLSHKLIFIFSLRSQLMFIGIRVMRPSRKEISSMLFIFTLKELK